MENEGEVEDDKEEEEEKDEEEGRIRARNRGKHTHIYTILWHALFNAFREAQAISIKPLENRFKIILSEL